MHFGRMAFFGTLCGVLFFGFFFSCGFDGDSADSGNEVHIRNGQEVKANDASLLRASTVSLTTAAEQAEGRSVCTGTLISPRAVMTAAHCLVGSGAITSPEKMLVSFGVRVGDASSQLRRASRFVVHPGYRSDFLSDSEEEERSLPPNDIAVVILQDTAPAPYRPAPVFTGQLKKGLKVTLAGFGVVFTRAYDNSGTLRKTRSKIQKVFASRKVIQVGKNSSRRVACSGDSGGPLFVKTGSGSEGWAVAGVTSTGSLSALFGGCSGPNFYTNALEYRSFLQGALAH